jgi:recombination protein RecR
MSLISHIVRCVGYRRQHSLRGRFGIGPEELKIPGLLKRTKQNKVREVILGFGTDARGETTALYLAKELSGLGAKITRLATGVAAGSGLEFVDSITLGQALAHRRSL